MNVIAINGSPRKNGNTITLLKEALKGAESQDIQTQQVDLYDLKYKGCVSCFYCKRKDRPHGTCAMRDDLSPLLEKLKAVDAVIFGSPIYYDNITSGMTAFLERFLFSNYIYSEDIPTVFPKKLPTGFIYSMNITKEQSERVHVPSNLEKYQRSITEVLGHKPELLYVYNTWQFTDYSKYESSIFSEKDKRKQRKEQFPLDCKAAYDMGVLLAKRVK
ncbi:MAG: flavodoxin family protein [Ruminococcus flavefaciens]|nr:flavodoxin family protein [Ruminococcus flavefaciens]MCM1362881.1 flavodoxin family protein [Clostridiales bacterium]